MAGVPLDMTAMLQRNTFILERRAKSAATTSEAAKTQDRNTPTESFHNCQGRGNPQRQQKWFQTSLARFIRVVHWFWN